MNRKNILFLISAVAVLFLVNAVFGPVNITRAANSPVTGYAWSDNIGWIQMNPAFGGVQIDSSTGEGIFSGYAWSDNIGWVNFAPTSGFPETPSEGAKLNLSTGQITGWIKAVAADNNGWDGWIKMRGGTGSVITCPSGYIYNSVTLKCEASPTYSCASDYTYNSSTGKCEQSPSCPSGGSYNSSTNRCEVSIIASCGGITSITDTRDTNNPIYNTVEIGTQCWLARNENVGTRIAATSYQTNNAVLEKYCYDNTEANCNTDGGLYQWNEAMQYVTTEGAQGICPAGWHIPKDSEWYTLENYLKITGQTCDAARTSPAIWDCNDAGTKLKSGGTSGFNAPLIGVRRYTDGAFVNRDIMTRFWSTTQYDASNSRYREMYSTALPEVAAKVSRYYYPKAGGFPIRCLKDGDYTACPSGYTLNGSICTASATCPSGGALNNTTDKCELAPITSCPSGGSFNSSTGKCEADPTLGGGSGSSYGVNVNLATGAFLGYAWGSDVVGWVSFSGVTMNPSAPAVTLSASPNPVDYNTASTLTWTSTNVTSCDASGDWSGNKATSGSESTGNLTSAKTYTITCTGPGGTVSGSVTVEVNPFVPVCGDDICNGSETCSTCSQDCGVCVPVKDFNLNSSNAIFASLIGGAPSVSTPTTITVTDSVNFSGDVVLSVESINPPLPGASYNWNPNNKTIFSPYSNGVEFSVNIPAGTPANVYTIKLLGNGGGGLLYRYANDPIFIKLNVEAIEPSWIEI